MPLNCPKKGVHIKLQDDEFREMFVRKILAIHSRSS